MKTLLSLAAALALCSAPATAQTASSTTFGTGCKSVAFYAKGVPTVGGSFALELAHNAIATAKSIAILHFGVSDKTWLTVPLPADLGPFGAKGCPILCSGEIAFALVLTPGLNLKVPQVVPNDKALLGVTYYNQFLTLNVTSTIELASSNGGKAVVGYATN
ncbi:MAG: hypothetical protein R3F30_07735 [Planctomycetota bacterium]